MNIAILKLLRMTVIVFLISGCSVASKSEKALFWPAFPEQPRVAYVKSFRQETDFRKRNFFDAIFGVSSTALFSKPYGVYVEGENIYVTDTGNVGVMVYNAAEQKFRFVFGDDDRLSRPMGVALSADGTLFVSDAKKGKVFGFDKEGKTLVVIGRKGELTVPVGIAINKAKGWIYIADSRAHKIFVYSVKGEPLFSFGQEGSGDAQFLNPTNIAIDRRNGKVYVVDTLNCRVQVFDKDGKFLSKFGELGDTPGTFTRPKGIGVDTEGHVYVTDAAFDNFQIFDESGTMLLDVGRGGSERGRFSLPAGLYVDENDRIYVADQANQRVQIFQYLSEKWKKENPGQYSKYLAPPVP